MRVNSIQLNIGLNNNPHTNKEDIKTIIKALALPLDNVRFEDGEWGNEVEPTLVYKAATFDPLTVIRNKVKQLCVIFKQDAIALTYNGNGKLIYHPRYKRKRIKFSHKYFIKF